MTGGGVLFECRPGLGQVLSSYSIFSKVTGCCSLITLLIKFEFQHPFANPLKYFKEFLQASYFEALKSVIDPRTQQPYQSSTSYEIYSDDGVTPLPAFFKDLMLGTLTYQQAKEIWYASSHPDFLNKVFEFSANPERFIAPLTLLPAADLLRQCAQQINPDGSKKHVCIVLSNMAQEVVPYLKAKFASEIFQYIDYCIFSGEVHCAKPDKSIYEICLKYIETLPKAQREKIYFIDDQIVNGLAGQHYIPGLIYLQPDDAPETFATDGVIAAA